MTALNIRDQGELCRRVREAGGKLSQAQASQLLTGMTKRPRCLPELAVALNTNIAYLTQDESPGNPTVSPDSPQIVLAPRLQPVESAAAPLLMFLTSAAMAGSRAGEIVVNKSERIGQASRPTELQFSKNAFCFTVLDDELEPRYSRRDTLIVDPAAPAAPDDDVILVRDPTAEKLQALPVRLLRITPSHWIVRRFSTDAKEQRISRTEFVAALTIFGSYRRR